MYGVVRALHDPNSRLLSGALEGLRTGSVVVVDISLLSSAAGNMLSGLMLRRIFAHNQENFTAGEEHPIIPAIAIVEEAQSVLGRNLDESSPFVEWVKEGRKYELGAILITQQPGSMAPELLSQADNWFCFHLLSEGDAGTLGKYNSHYSDDVLSHLIAEPIPGNCFMWSAPHQPFVLPVRIRNFEGLYKNNVQPSASAESIVGIRAQKVLKAMSEALDELKNGLLEVLNSGKAKFVQVDDELVGIYSGQLYYMIQQVKQPSDIQPEEQLKKPLMSLILGEGSVRIVKHSDNKEYYCTSLDNWTKALGKKPRVSRA
jgi:DNA helicase HerA-like ATPase